MIKRFALIRNSRVQNVVECEETIAQNIFNDFDYVIQTDIAGPGWFYTVGSGFLSGSFTVVSINNTNRKIEKVGFLTRFTTEEIKNIRRNAKSNEETDVFLFLVENSVFINLDSTTVISGMQHLVSLNLITQERSNIILSSV